MKTPVDIHTHHQFGLPGEAIISNPPEDFTPQKLCWYSIGIHPWEIRNNPIPYPTMKWKTFEKQSRHPQVLAIGEAGLDKRIGTPLPLQKQLFIRQALLAEELCKPLIIHAVKAANELWMLKEQIKPSNPWIIHGFRGNAILAEQYIHHGFYLSFGEYYHQEALCFTPANRLFLETDESSIPITTFYERAAILRGMSTDTLLRIIRENIEKVFFK
ncbi:MAG: TatD family hydrolase [Bacteroides sp.]|jgi:TatD DNase family protein|nr:TatD family hydrolase [Bacteroides sp.]